MKEHPQNRRPLEWVNLLFFIISPLVAIGGITWVSLHGGIHWATWILAVFFLYATGLGITAGYHRLLSHRSYDANRFVSWVLMLLAGASFEGPATEWCSDHRYHHRFVDHEGDPYNIKKGLWYAHIGWIIRKLEKPRNFQNIKDLNSDFMIQFQERHYLPLAILVSFVLPTMIAALWGDALGGFFLAGVARVVFNQHATFCINSLCHAIGSQPYSSRHTGRDSWFTALFTYGEGYHNFHHEFPGDYRNGLRGYHFDPGKWLIRFCEKFGWAYNIRRANPAHIFQTKLKMQESILTEKIKADPSAVKIHFEEFLQKNRIRVEEAHLQFLKMKAEYQRIKKEKFDYLHDQREKVRDEFKKAQENFKLAREEWRALIQGPVTLSS